MRDIDLTIGQQGRKELEMKKAEMTEHALKSARDALWAIANMQITETTNKNEVLGLCISIAKLELKKYSTAGRPEGAEK